MSEKQPIREVDAKTVHDWMRSGEAVVVDVRSTPMRETRSIAGTIGMPLNHLDFDALEIRDGQSVVFQCEVGITSMRAARLAAAHGMNAPIYNLKGGIREWNRLGLPVEGISDAPLSLRRPVWLGAGVAAAAGLALGIFVSPWYALGGAVVAVGILLMAMSGRFHA
jgi:rhodanese-related sulfurtransferase